MLRHRRSNFCRPSLRLRDRLTPVATGRIPRWIPSLEHQARQPASVLPEIRSPTTSDAPRYGTLEGEEMWGRLAEIVTQDRFLSPPEICRRSAVERSPSGIRGALQSKGTAAGEVRGSGSFTPWKTDGRNDLPSPRSMRGIAPPSLSRNFQIFPGGKPHRTPGGGTAPGSADVPPSTEEAPDSIEPCEGAAPVSDRSVPGELAWIGALGAFDTLSGRASS